MKLISLAIVFSLPALSAFAQLNPLNTDSLKTLLDNAKADTTRVMLLKTLGAQYLVTNPETAKAYFQEGYELSKSLNYRKGEADCLRFIGNVIKRQGQYLGALNNFLKALSISESIHDSTGISAGLGHIGDIYSDQGEHYKARRYFTRALEIDEKTHYDIERQLMLLRLGRSYHRQNIYDSAFLYLNQCLKLATKLKSNFVFDALLTTLGEVHADLGNSNEAMDHFRKSIPYSQKKNAHANLSDTYLGIAGLYKKRNQIDSCIFYGKNSLSSAQSVSYVKGIMDASQLLSEAYEGANKGEALKYYKTFMTAKDSLFNAEKVRQLQELGFAEQQRLESLAAAKLDYQNTLRLYTLLSLLGAFIVIAIILLVNNRNKRMANRTLHQQKEEIQRTLTELKTTQTQLIHSEKMASLGELTAGIAHEIQNPLNFVKNFSEVNKELLIEMKEELAKGNLGEATTLANNVIQNHEKINQHGNRADAIVKGMLQHSRNSSGIKEPTNVNVLVDEYLRLAYHGFRGKDRTFKVTTKTNFDERTGLINIVPQEIGRVILNLINNAFYAVSEKKKQAGDSYEPTVTVGTQRSGDSVLISVRDNGIGIPEKIRDKIFQPFYTTKPAGQGTGLGLSLSYDIVKAHNGTINLKANNDREVEFVIELPVSQ